MRRRSPRRQSKPCPGCGATGEYRLIDQVCNECRRVLKAARKHEEYVAAALKEGRELVVLPHTGSWHWWPRFYQGKSSTSNENRESRDVLGHALAELSTLVGELTTAQDTRQASLLTHDGYSIYGVKHSGGGDCWQGTSIYDHRALYLFNPRVAELFRVIYDAIGRSLEFTDADGRRAGNNLLMELANGGLTIDEFNAVYLPPAVANNKRKGRVPRGT